MKTYSTYFYETEFINFTTNLNFSRTENLSINDGVYYTFGMICGVENSNETVQPNSLAYLNGNIVYFNPIGYLSGDEYHTIQVYTF